MASTYGRGAYGVGPYARASPVNAAAAGGSSGRGSTRFVVSPVARPLPARSLFNARARAVVGVTAAFAPAAWTGFGGFRAVVVPVMRPRPSAGRFGGRNYALLQGLEFYSGPAIFRGGGHGGTGLWSRLCLPRAAGIWKGHAGPYVLRPQWHRSLRASSSGWGYWSGQTHPQARARGSGTFGGRAAFYLLFRTPLRPAYGGFSGRAHVSYTWSDLTAPGRTPDQGWSAIPGASPPSDLWTLIPPAGA